MNNRLQNVDFLRFLFAIILGCAHLLMGLGNNSPVLQKMGSLALYPTILTDFFFYNFRVFFYYNLEGYYFI